MKADNVAAAAALQSGEAGGDWNLTLTLAPGPEILCRVKFCSRQVNLIHSVAFESVVI